MKFQLPEVVNNIGLLPTYIRINTMESPRSSSSSPLASPPSLSFKRKSETYTIVDPTGEPSTEEVSWMGHTYKLPFSYIKAYQDIDAANPEKFLDLRDVIRSEMMRRHNLIKNKPAEPESNTNAMGN